MKNKRTRLGDKPGSFVNLKIIIHLAEEESQPFTAALQAGRSK